MLALVCILTALYPTEQGFEYSAFREGTIAPEEVIAPETFYVSKNEAGYNHEVETVRKEIAPVIDLNTDLFEQKELALHSFIEDLVTRSKSVPPDSLVLSLKQAHSEIGPLSESSLRSLIPHAIHDPAGIDSLKVTVLGFLTPAYARGILREKSSLIEAGYTTVTLIQDREEKRISLEDILDREELTLTLQETITLHLPESSAQEIRTIFELVVGYLAPNLSYNVEETQKRQDTAVASISRIKGTVLKNERIINEHERITSEHIDKLNSLRNQINQRRREDPSIGIIEIGARAILTAIIVAIFFSYLSISRADVYRRTSNSVLFSLIILMPAVIAHYAVDDSAISPFLVPIALSAMLTTVLFDAEVGLVVSLVSSAICASMLGSLQYGLVFLITGVIGAFSVRTVIHRSDFYRPIVYLVVTYTLTIAATNVLQFQYYNASEFFEQVKLDLVFGVFTACASCILTIGLLPIFESVFNVVTSITLLELSDLNRPLLRNLAIRAPGTYSHSMNMASLCEASAEAIGADPLLSRVGCYYHDIGKMIRPHYFIENQRGINPHDELQPKMSALILISHVKEGIELAREEGLPRTIINLIPQHHGTSEIASFKHRALERGDKQAVRDEDFRYPGPKPQTKEAGIINLADAVESATRTLATNDPDQIKGMVQTIVKGRFTAGELDECDLTLRDLNHIQEAFLPILLASRHHRVPYPWQTEQQKTRERRREGQGRL
ncbi:MAG: HDIG domain-containing protein [bacterium]|nr:HDIG domain-containing protein [bacterium]